MRRSRCMRRPRRKLPPELDRSLAGVFVFAEHSTQRVGNFADSGVCLCRGEDPRHQVLRAAGGGFKFQKALVPAPGITGSPYFPQALDLRLLIRRIDPEDQGPSRVPPSETDSRPR